ncbi:pentapeptide repeat-containing protein [Ekhidna sp.]|jgi:fluoroquinolone resistance protein|uniref:pentapeptide repeat-containing protein n=1 Tax=Ekhidna sp. TaxID=2608089 RepID=UPI0032EEC6FE
MLIADKKFEKLEELSNRDEYEGCTFLNCNLANGNFSTTRFIECEFVDCNLSNVLISETSFREVTFRNCKMIGIQFDTCNQLLFEASFESCQLDHSVFFQMKLKQAHFMNCQLVETDFSETDLSSSKLVGCDLSGAKFDHTNLEKADLTRSFNFMIDPETNSISQAKISLSQLPGLLAKYNLEINKDL